MSNNATVLLIFLSIKTAVYFEITFQPFDVRKNKKVPWRFTEVPNNDILPRKSMQTYAYWIGCHRERTDLTHCLSDRQKQCS